MKRTLLQAVFFLCLVTVFLLTCGVEPLKVSKETGAPHAFVRSGIVKDSLLTQDTSLFSKCDTVRVGDTETFLGVINPPDSRVKRVQWNFADNAEDTQPVAMHAYDRGGIYHAVFSIFDKVGNRLADSVIVCVNSPPDSIRIISPVQGSVVQSLTPALSWKGYDRDEFDTSLVYMVVADRGNGVADTLVLWSEDTSVVLDKNIKRGDHISWFVLVKDKFGAIVKSRIASFSIQPSSDASLRSLDVSVGRLMPKFNSTDSVYCDTVANTVKTIDLSFSFNEAAATMSINGTTIDSGVALVSLNTPRLTNVFTLKTVAPDNKTSKTYALTVIRIASANAFLSNIRPSIGNIDPAFSDTIFAYNDTVPLATTSISLTPLAQDTSALIAVNGTPCKSGDSSAATTLTSNKAEKIFVVVSAQDGKTQQTYTVTVIRRTSSDASLSSLEISAGTLKSCAAPIADTLRDTVSFMDSAVSITPSVLDTQASITINSASVKSAGVSSIALPVGTTEVKIKVIAPNGITAKAYVLYIIRKPDSTIPLTDPPSGISATGISISAIRIAWNDNPAATFYEIQRGAQATGVFATRGSLTSNSFIDTGLQSGATRYYRVNASNSKGATAFSTAVSATTFLKPSFTAQPQPQTVTETQRAVFSVVAAGIPSPSYQWQKNKMNIPLSNFTACTTAVLTAGDNNVRFRCIISNAAGVDTSDEAVLKVDSLFTKPFIGRQPGDTSIVTGSDIVLWIADTGSYLKVQWRKDGADLPLSVSCTLSIKAAKATDAGMYSVKAWNRLDSAISKPFQLGVLPKTLTGLSAQARSTASIGVSWNLVDGASWYRVLRALGTNAYASICSTSQTSMVDTPLTEGASCTYKLSVGNASGETVAKDSVTSSTWFGPQISVPPQPQRIIIGQAINLSVTAAGLPACSFQWKKDGSAIAGATQSTFALTNSTLGDSGDYNVMVINAVRAVNSNSAHVTVVPLYSLSTASNPTAGGTIIRSKTAASYQRGDTVRLSAQVASGYRFIGWSGDTVASDSAILVIMTKNKSINANFIKQFKLTMSSTTHGSVNPTGTIVVDSGASTSITATPEVGCKFSVWRAASGNAAFTDSTAATSSIRLTQGDANVIGIFKIRTFIKTFGGTKDDRAYWVKQTSDGGYIITGSTYSFSGGTSAVYLIKTNGNGDTIWTKNFGGAGEYFGYYVQQASDGGYLVTGYMTPSGGGQDVYLIKTDSLGTELWTKTYGGDSTDVGRSVQQTSDGGYIIIGSTNSFGAGNMDAYLIKTDASGNATWTKTIGTPNVEYPFDGRLTSDGGIIICGYTNPAGGKSDIYLAKTDASGNATWTKAIGTDSNDRGNSVRQTSDGGYIITGQTYSLGAGNSDVYLVKTDASGTITWTKTFGGTGDDCGYCVQLTSDGGYIITGYTKSFGAGGFDVYLIKTDASGTAMWTKTFGGAGSEAGFSARQTSDGGYVVLGMTTSFGAGGYDVYLIKTDENGNTE